MSGPDGSARHDGAAVSRPVFPEVLDFDEAAAFLGVSTKTFAKVLRLENLPGRKVGREWKFAKSALLAWLSSGSTRDYHDDDSDAPAEGAPPLRPAEIRPQPWRSEPQAPRAGSRREAYSAEED